jgi:hypothetical protein
MKGASPGHCCHNDYTSNTAGAPRDRMLQIWHASHAFCREPSLLLGAVLLLFFFDVTAGVALLLLTFVTYWCPSATCLAAAADAVGAV